MIKIKINDKNKKELSFIIFKKSLFVYFKKV